MTMMVDGRSTVAVYTIDDSIMAFYAICVYLNAYVFVRYGKSESYNRAK